MKNILDSVRLRRIVTHGRGSWKWQDAFALATYCVRQTRDGRLVWANVETVGKRSRPQVARSSWAEFAFGGAHNRPVDPREPDVRAAIESVCATVGLEGLVAR